MNNYIETILIFHIFLSLLDNISYSFSVLTRYVPPGKRNQFNQQRNARHGPPGNAPNRIPVHQPPPQPTAPRLAGQQSREDLPPRMASQHSREDLPPRLAAQQSREDIPPRLASQSSREDLPPRLTGQHSREDLPPRLAAQHSREDVSPRLAAQQSREDVKVNGNGTVFIMFQFNLSLLVITVYNIFLLESGIC